MDALIRKTAEVPAPVIEAKKREVHAYVSIFGNRDSVGDIVHPGAFAKSLGPGSRLARRLVPVKHNHERIVGKMLDAREDSTGLFTVQKFSSDPESERIFGMVEDGTIPTFSFKARIPSGGQRKEKIDGVVTNHLTEMELLEAGPADPDLAVNDRTYVVATKGLPELATAVAAMAGMFGSEQWCSEAMLSLTPEEQDALRMFIGSLPVVGKCVSMLLGEMDAADAEDPVVYDAAIGKTLQLSEAIEQWQIKEAIKRIEAFQPSGFRTAN